MQSNKNIIDIGKKLPFGAKKKIAKKAGLHYNTVVGYFSGRPTSYHTEILILNNASEYLKLVKELEENRQKLLNYEL